MFQTWQSPDLKTVRGAVEEAVRDLESLEIEVKNIEEEYQTSARVLRADYWGIRAATRKRLAEVQFLSKQPREQWENTLREVLEDYHKGLNQGIQVDHWLAAQYLVLRSVLNTRRDEDKDYDFWWEEACRIASAALHSVDPYERMWGHSSLADLGVVAIGEGLNICSTGMASEPNVHGHLKEMVREGGGPRNCPAIWSTFRQFWRWHYWWTTRPEWKEVAQEGYAYLWNLLEARFQSFDEASHTPEQHPPERST